MRCLNCLKCSPSTEKREARALAPKLIEDWRPEDPAFWNRKPESQIAVAQSLDCQFLHCFLSFAVWMVWSVVVAKLPQIGFAYTTDQLFWLAALPGLSGATLQDLLQLHGAGVSAGGSGRRSQPGR
jgi:NNP family nitrate/nitrite transporter-like MFS transporter